VNRSAALDYLQGEYAEIAAETGLEESPLLKAYNTAIDQSLRGLGYVESDIGTADTTDAQVIGYLALLDFYALTRFNRIFALRMDVNVSGSVSASQSQMFKHVKMLLDAAQKRLDGLGLSQKEQVVMGRVTLDYLEPGWAGDPSWGGMF
jgi:hypothetical protein